jgi:DNA-binding HxlR family transcriptional regulator
MHFMSEVHGGRDSNRETARFHWLRWLGGLTSAGAEAPLRSQDNGVDGSAHWTPLDRGLQAIKDRWSLLILNELLLAGPLRVGQLQDRIPGIASVALRDCLRRMTGEDLLHRRSGEPQGAEYELSEAGRELVSIVQDLSRWALKRLWSEPQRHEQVSLGVFIRQLTLLLSPDQLPSGVIELLAVDGERRERHVLSLQHGKMTFVGDELTMPWTRIEGSSAAWIDALSSGRLGDQLRVTGDRALALALLDALPEHA